jgi:hypothetical protein
MLCCVALHGSICSLSLVQTLVRQRCCAFILCCAVLSGGSLMQRAQTALALVRPLPVHPLLSSTVFTLNAQVGASILSEALALVSPRPVSRPEVVMGLESPDDAALIRCASEMLWCRVKWSCAKLCVYVCV